MPEKTAEPEIRAQVERVTYYNEENHYTIAKVRIEGRNSQVTVVGTLYSVVPGESLRLKGSWEVHPRWGEQFRIASYETLMPATVKGIERYLGSGMIKGIGPVMAKRLVARFREETLDVIDTDMDRLGEVPGIGQKRIEMIRMAWEEQKEVRNVMVFLQGNGVSPAYAAKIYRFYGGDAVRMVRENPYRLAVDIFGIGFLTADSIAAKLGIGKEAPLRIETGILYVLGQLASEGHLFFPRDLLVERCSEALEVDRERIPQALSSLAVQRKVVLEEPGQLSGGAARYRDGIVYLASLYVSEKGTAELLARLAAHPRQMRLVNVEEALRWVEGTGGVSFSLRQLDAVRASLEQKVLVITGGPGTGKTTIIKGIIAIAGKTGQKVLLAAPTGRAAKRMTEATGMEARTIHRLLEYGPGSVSSEGGFKRNESNHLDAGLIIIDEASMVDVSLMYHLLKAVPPQATLVLVGDVDQLPSVGPGSVLKDIISSGCVGCVRLSEIFRQSTKSMIIVNAHRINAGEMPFFEKNAGQGHDFVFVDIEDPDEVLRYVVGLCRDEIPSRFGFHPVKDVQVLTPMHRGVVGVSNMNARLQEALNSSTDGISRGGRFFKRGDKVLQTRNNYEKDVYNGDIGTVISMDREVQELKVDFEGKVVSYDFNELDELILAYAISVHKSQGSEYPVVVMPILTQHYLLLQRNLLYTAITRGKKLVYLVGTRKALSIAIRNDTPHRRYTLLAERLREAETVSGSRSQVSS
jgi:exodeoxyribonuclease V alpha subunit